MKIIVVAPSLATFVEKDLKTLQEFSATRLLLLKSTKGFGLIKALLYQFAQLIKYIRESDCCFIWFADYHSLLPACFSRIFGKKCVIVLGGTDVNCIPELKYGYCSNIIRRIATLASITLCDSLLPVDNSLAEKLESRNPKLKEKILTVPTGFNGNLWFCDTPKKNLILTVAMFSNWQRIKIKGIDFFVEVAKLLPEYQFAIVGAKAGAEKLLDVPSNLTVYTQVLTHEELRKLFSQARIYAQFSLTEGLPSTVCEAMLCQCVPIGTDVGGMKNAIGQNGVLLREREPRVAGAKIREIFGSEDYDGEKARRHILYQFSSARREETLKSLLKS